MPSTLAIRAARPPHTPVCSGQGSHGVRGRAAPWRVRERTPAGDRAGALLEGAWELRFVSLDALPVVVRALAAVGHVVLVQYDAATERLAFYARPLRAGAWDSPRQADGVTEARGGAALPDDARADDARADEGESARPFAEPFSGSAGPEYESEGSQRLTIGAVTIGPGRWWSAELSVPEPDGATLFLRLERHGALPAGYLGATGMELSVAPAEIDAVVAVLAGVVAQARRDGVLRRPAV